MLDPSVETAYAGAPTRAAVRMPVTAGVPAQARVGTSVTGYANADVEVGQQAGGLDLVTGAAFDGWAGRVVVRPGTGGLVLEATGTFTWARPDASAMDLAFRMPVGMGSTTPLIPGSDRIDSPAARMFRIPILGQGQASVDAAVALSTDDVAKGRFAVLAVAMRPLADGGAEPVVVLGSVRR